MQNLNTSETPFVAAALGCTSIQIVCAKAVVSKLFKLLFAQQAALGVRLVDVKSHVTLAPMDLPELRDTLALDIVGALQRAGWWRLESGQGGAHLLGTDVTAAADGRAHIADSVLLRVEIQPPGSVLLLMKPTTVRFRHPIPALSSSAAAAQAPAPARSICCVLPTLTPGIINGTHQASPEEADRLCAAWAAVGRRLPLSAFSTLVDVCFDEDPDAATYPVPPCAVLSSRGIDKVQTRLQSAEVQAVVLRLKGTRDLSSTLKLLVLQISS